PGPVAPDGAAIGKAARLIRQARQPLIWAGGGVIASGATQALRELAERIGAAVVTSASGRGALPEDHPQCIGFFGVDTTVAPIFEQSDLLLAVGTRLRDTEPRGWQRRAPSARLQL